MRGVSLPVEPVFSMLRDEFVVGWKDIITEKFVGESHGYTVEQTSVGTTNGAGPHNVHLFVISPDGVVLHALPGFWHPEDLARELKLAQSLWRVWQDGSLDLAAKQAAFRKAQLDAIATASKQTLARSGWQGFDAKNELKRHAKGVDRDTLRRDADGELVLGKDGKPRVKNVYQIVHERIAARPFVPFADFDVHAWCDYGRTYYDNNKKVDGAGTTFMTPKRVAAKEAKAAEEARRQRVLRERHLKRMLGEAHKRADQRERKAAREKRNAERKAREAAAKAAEKDKRKSVFYE